LYPGRTKWIAVVLAVFGGWFGAHKFYLGKTRTGILYLLFFWTSLPFLISLVDALVIALKPQFDFQESEFSTKSQMLPASQSVLESNQDWRPAYKSNEAARPLLKSPLFWVPIVFVIALASNALLGDGQPVLQNSQSPARTSTSETTSSFSSEDKACAAMKAADMAVAALGRKVTNGTAKSGDASSIDSALAQVNKAYKSAYLDGGEYSKFCR